MTDQGTSYCNDNIVQDNWKKYIKKAYTGQEDLQ